MKKMLSVFGAFAFLLFFSECNQQNSSKGQLSETDLKASEAALVKADSGWSAATGAKDSSAFSSFLMDEVVGMAPNAPVQNGKIAFTNLMKGFFSIPGFYVKWQPTKAEVAKSGEVGYTYGAYSLEFNDSTGNKITDKGKYATIWKKQNDGSWKVAVDVFNSDVPVK